MSDSQSSSSDVVPAPSTSSLSRHERLPGLHESRLPVTINVESPTTPGPQSAVAPPPPEDSWVSVGRDLTSSPEGNEGRTSAEFSASSHSHSELSCSPPNVPPKSPRTSKNIRRSITNGFKRMSLHRSPSNRSLTRSSSLGRSSKESPHSQSPQPRSPSPPEVPPLPAVIAAPPPRKRIKTLYPASMYCHEVYSQRSAHERIMIYAQKINDLYACECGLSDWVMTASGKSMCLRVS
jgi:hypothetical protein